MHALPYLVCHSVFPSGLRPSEHWRHKNVLSFSNCSLLGSPGYKDFFLNWHLRPAGTFQMFVSI